MYITATLLPYKMAVSMWKYTDHAHACTRSIPDPSFQFFLESGSETTLKVGGPWGQSGHFPPEVLNYLPSEIKSVMWGLKTTIDDIPSGNILPLLHEALSDQRLRIPIYALPISHILHCGYYTLLPLSFTNSAINHKNCVSDPKCSQKIVRIQSLLI